MTNANRVALTILNLGRPQAETFQQASTCFRTAKNAGCAIAALWESGDSEGPIWEPKSDRSLLSKSEDTLRGHANVCGNLRLLAVAWDRRS